MATEPFLATSIHQPTSVRTCAANSSPWRTYAAILSADLVALSSLFWLAVLWRHLLSPSYPLRSYLDFFPCLAMLLAAISLQGLYPGLLMHPAEEMRRIFAAVSTVFLILGSTTFLWHSASDYSRSVFLVSWAAGSPMILLSRYITRVAVGRRSWFGVPAIILGSGATAQRVIGTLSDGMLGLKVAGVLSGDNPSSWGEDLPPLLGHITTAPEVASAGIARYAVVAMPENSKTELRRAIQDYCRGFQHVLLIPDLPGLCSLGISAREIGGEVALELPQRLFHRSAATLKRALDCLASTALLLVSAPLFLVVAAAIKLTSPGPVFFGHTRYGREGKTFSALKFRTMTLNAREMLEEHLAASPTALAEWQQDQKLKNDPRITRVGKWLRRASLDELPQLLNVFIGDMSLVGPRPIVYAEIPKYGQGYDLYTRVRPGITGLWQVSGRNNTTYAERVSFDEYYVRNWSIWLDLYLLIRTIKVVITADGAY